MDSPRNTELSAVLGEVRRIEVEAARFARDALSGGLHTLFRGAGIEFADVREYAAGDDRRSVDWNVTARMGRPFVRRFVDERELRLVFAVDVGPAVDAGFGAWSVRQAAARVCASLAVCALESGDRVGLIAYGARIAHYARPDKGRRHVLGLVRDVLDVRHVQGPSAPEVWLELALRVLRRRTIVVWISNFAALPDVSRLSVAARRHDLVAVRLLPPEIAGLPRGLVELREPGNRRTTLVDGSDRRTRESYAKRVEQWHVQTAGALARARIDLIDLPIPTRADPDVLLQPLARYFHSHRGTGRMRR